MPTDRDIWHRVEELRQQFPFLRADHLPLDLITFVELELRLDIIPDDGVLRDFGADAAIMSEFTARQSSSAWIGKASGRRHIDSSTGTLHFPISPLFAMNNPQDRARHEAQLLAVIKERLPELRELLAKAEGHWAGEDGFYRFYHQSFKVYGLQGTTREIVASSSGPAGGGDAELRKPISSSRRGSRFWVLGTPAVGRRHASDLFRRHPLRRPR